METSQSLPYSLDDAIFLCLSMDETFSMWKSPLLYGRAHFIMDELISLRTGSPIQKHSQCPSPFEKTHIFLEALIQGCFSCEDCYSHNRVLSKGGM